MAIGLGTVNGIPMPVPGSISAISNLCDRWVEITPGREKKKALERENRVVQRTYLSPTASDFLSLATVSCAAARRRDDTPRIARIEGAN